MSYEPWDYFIGGVENWRDGRGPYQFKTEADMRSWFAATINPPSYANTMYRVNRNRKAGEPAAIRIEP